MTAPLATVWIDPLLRALDHAGIGLVITRDGPGGLERLYDNDSMTRILGRSREELRTIPVMSVLPAEELTRIAALRQRVLAGDEAPATLEATVQRPDGSLVQVEIGMAFHRDAEHHYSLVFLRDVSEQRALQARLLEADRLATVGALSSGLAHEINNPLTSVLLHLGALRRTLDRWVPEGDARCHVKDVLDQVIEGSERVARAIRELSVFVDPALGRAGPVDVHQIVETAVRTASPFVESRARLSVHLESVRSVHGDPPRLGQAVLNLLLDAALAFDDADRSRNLVEVTLRDEDAWVVLEVADNGRALSPARAERAFEPFFPARGATSTGIGLAVARTIVASLGGRTTIRPRDGHGAIATVHLPTR